MRRNKPESPLRKTLVVEECSERNSPEGRLSGNSAIEGLLVEEALCW